MADFGKSGTDFGKSGTLIEREDSDGFVVVNQQPAGAASWPQVLAPHQPAAPPALAAQYAICAVEADTRGEKPQARVLYEQAALQLGDAAAAEKDPLQAQHFLQKAKEYADRAHDLTPPGEKRAQAAQPRNNPADPAYLDARGEKLMKQAHELHEEGNFLRAKQRYAEAAGYFASAGAGVGDEASKILLARKAAQAQDEANRIARAMGLSLVNIVQPPKAPARALPPSIWDEFAARAARHTEAGRHQNAFDLYTAAVERLMQAAKSVEPQAGQSPSPVHSNLTKRALLLLELAEQAKAHLPPTTSMSVPAAFAPGSEGVHPSAPMAASWAAGTSHSAPEDERMPDALCVICYDQPASHIIAPCGHLCLCEAHHSAVKTECPICRCHVASVIRVYKP